MLNSVLARAQRSCCAAMDGMVPGPEDVEAFERRIVEMFRDEWRLAGHARPLATIAIVDEAPERQHLYAEFLLFRRLFERHGILAVVADPSALQWRDGTLWHEGRAIDLVYNRLTDFYLENPGNAALRQAWLQQGVALTPHPRAHALYADKRLLAIFSDSGRLADLGVPEASRQLLLDCVPHTEVVTAADGERLWTRRRNLFFKPVAGFGSRAAYRGDKLTRRVWEEILAGDYVAQTVVPPGERLVDGAEGAEGAQAMKFDLRAYVYGGEVQWVAARLYQGQTTNFRTPGGGFAPVYSTIDVSGLSAAGAVVRTGRGGRPGFLQQGVVMDIKVLGTGCANCKNTIALIEQVARDRGANVTLSKVEELEDIVGYGVISTPGVVIDGKVVHAGGVPSRDKVEQWFAA